MSHVCRHICHIYVTLGFRNVHLVMTFKVSLNVVKCQHICDIFSTFKETKKVIKMGHSICPNVLGHNVYLTTDVGKNNTTSRGIDHS